jgi:hypothetical protein
MPKILDRLVSQLTANGMPKDKAYAVATKKLQESGNLKKGTREATAKGVKRGNMTPAQRAKDRAAKASGGKASDYKYNKKNNSAVKGKVNSSVKKRK